jgi:hypothetical protein
MTMQMHDLAAQRSGGGWVLAWVPHGGNSRIHLLDERGDRLRSLSLERGKHRERQTLQTGISYQIDASG